MTVIFNCTSLTRLDVNNFGISKLTNTSAILQG
ncbi:MAG: hypothetical protein IKO28_02550 [Prevotella sp.]|nr:hypothetical protein [Prevotella sp.]